MKEIIITSNESGKRLDKFLSQFFSEASMGFLYKMLRKKNIVLNGKKSDGKEVLKEGDSIKVFFSDETYDKFVNKLAKSDQNESQGAADEYRRAYKELQKEGLNIDKIIYEDEDIILINKPVGVLSQKSDNGDLSTNEWLIGYLLDSKGLDPASLGTFRPSVCNRLDRNTSGIVIGSKSLKGARVMARLLSDRTLHKYYLTLALGHVKEDADISGYLIKDEKNNKVKLFKDFPEDDNKAFNEYEKEKSGKADEMKASRIETAYHVLQRGEIDGIDVTILEVELKTGKPHQIRAHLSSIGHPIAGDHKYGYPKENAQFKKAYGLRSQLLHAYRLVFPDLKEELPALSGKEFIADKPHLFDKIAKSIEY